MIKRNALTPLLLGAAMLLPVHWLNGAVLVHDGFESSPSGAGGTTGIYKSGTSVTGAPNANVTGGNIIGFESDRSWGVGAGYFTATHDDQGNGRISIARGTGGTVRNLARQLSSETLSLVTSQSVLYASTSIQFTSLASTSTDLAFAGFTDVTGTNPGAGAFVGFIANSDSGWDLQVRFVNASGSIQLETIATNVQVTDSQMVVWRMDQGNNTIDFWINPDSEASQKHSFSFSSTGVQNIGYARSLARLPGTTASEMFHIDYLTLGTEWSDVAPIPEPAAASLIVPIGALICLRMFKNKR